MVFSRFAKFHKLGKLGADDRQRKLIWPRLVARLHSMIKQDVLDARAVANAVYSIAELFSEMGPSKEVTQLVPESVKIVQLRAGHMQPQGLSNCLWAAAMLRTAMPALLPVVPAVSRQIVLNKKDRLKSQDLANNLWAAAHLQDAAPEILTAVSTLARRFPREAHNMNHQEASNSLWAAAKLYEAAPDVLEILPALVMHIPTQVSNIGSQDLSN